MRLLQPISSYSAKPGNLVQGILIEAPLCDGAPVLPMGAGVEGRIKAVQRVGMGFHHEAAKLEIDFNRILLGPSKPLEIHARVVDIDNARETVKDGVIRGVRSTGGVQSTFTARLVELPTLAPSTMWILPASRAAFPVFPEPEISFPRGTDLVLQLAAPLQLGTSDIEFATSANREFEESERDTVDKAALSLPERAYTTHGLDGDIVNLAFIGSREQLEAAFQTAGWTGSDTVSTRSVLREFRALLSLNNYPRLPISRQMLDGASPDFRWQKSLNSYAKRDHLRIWSRSEPLLGQPLWLSGSIHEVSAKLSLSSPSGRFRFIHHVDADLDEARDRVVRDLILAGCVDAVHYASRPSMTHSLQSPSGDQLRTDGELAVVRLRNCQDPIFEKVSLVPAPPLRDRTTQRWRVIGGRKC